MQSFILGYPRIGKNRELKKVLENYWKNNCSFSDVQSVCQTLRKESIKNQSDSGLSFVTCNDFSMYDHVLDTSVLFGVEPERFADIPNTSGKKYFAMARGFHTEDAGDAGYIEACEMTKWFDTNYHYLVPEFQENIKFSLNPEKVLNEIKEVREEQATPLPVFVGPVSFLYLGKEKGQWKKNNHRLNLLSDLINQYIKLFQLLKANQVKRILIEEPVLSLDLDTRTREAFKQAYTQLDSALSGVQIHLTPGYGHLGDNLELYCTLPVEGVHFNLIQGNSDIKLLSAPIRSFLEKKSVSLGLVDGQNIWKNKESICKKIIDRFREFVPEKKLFISGSTSFLHIPRSLESETKLSPELRAKLAFCDEKLKEIVSLSRYQSDNQDELSGVSASELEYSGHTNRLKFNEVPNFRRKTPYLERQQIQRLALGLPEFPTTTIGSFPQTAEVRKTRSQYKKGQLSDEQYQLFMQNEIEKSVRYQEDIQLDVLVHGEFERNDMVEYFAENLDGFLVSQNGWVQSYGTRCVKPPIIHSDIRRPRPLTVPWTVYAQSLTKKPVKGMLTGPLTILKWSFPRDDISRETSAWQIAAVLKEEVLDLESAGTKIIQVDEPAFREGMPLKKKEFNAYFEWATNCFRMGSDSVQDSTQIHTHMCYSEFNDIMEAIADLDADVISVETSRSHGELFLAFRECQYPNSIGPGVYDIHSPEIPSKQHMISLMRKAMENIPADRLWLNPDCGLKTRSWEEVLPALDKMVQAAQVLRSEN